MRSGMRQRTQVVVVDVVRDGVPSAEIEAKTFSDLSIVRLDSES